MWRHASWNTGTSISSKLPRCSAIDPFSNSWNNMAYSKWESNRSTRLWPSNITGIVWITRRRAALTLSLSEDLYLLFTRERWQRSNFSRIGCNLWLILIKDINSNNKTQWCNNRLCLLRRCLHRLNQELSLRRRSPVQHHHQQDVQFTNENRNLQFDNEIQNIQVN